MVISSIKLFTYRCLLNCEEFTNLVVLPINVMTSQRSSMEPFNIHRPVVCSNLWIDKTHWSNYVLSDSLLLLTVSICDHDIFLRVIYCDSRKSQYETSIVTKHMTNAWEGTVIEIAISSANSTIAIAIAVFFI